jgi:protein-tyrosine phosphatase
MAEAALRAEMRRQGTFAPVVSVGIGARRTGQPIDPRARREGTRRGIDMSGYRVKKLAPHHFRQASHIFVMDRQNLADVQALAPADCTAAISLLLDTLNDHKGREITDPYRGTQQDFARVWRQCAMAAREIAKAMLPACCETWVYWRSKNYFALLSILSRMRSSF